MKRMSDVFKLPVHASEFSESMPYEYLDDEEKEMCEHEAHAINHVDALADSLMEITEDYFLWCGDDPDLTTDQCHKLHQMMLKAQSALKAYRGEK